MFICPFILCACHLLSKSTGFCLHKKSDIFLSFFVLRSGMFHILLNPHKRMNGVFYEQN